MLQFNEEHIKGHGQQSPMNRKLRPWAHDILRVRPEVFIQQYQQRTQPEVIKKGTRDIAKSSGEGIMINADTIIYYQMKISY